MLSHASNLIQTSSLTVSLGPIYGTYLPLVLIMIWYGVHNWLSIGVPMIKFCSIGLNIYMISAYLIGYAPAP